VAHGDIEAVPEAKHDRAAEEPEPEA
jgi:hypothetical protein